MDRSRTPARRTTPSRRDSPQEIPSPARNAPRLARSLSVASFLEVTSRLHVPTQRRFTDVGCLLVVVLCALTLQYSYPRSEAAVPEHLTHGFDYRGRLCGVGIHQNASNLFWCRPKGEARINWADPICVKACPSGAPALCPLPKHMQEGETPPGPDDSFNFIKTITQRVVPSPTFATRQVMSYCIPDIVEIDEMDIITELFDGAGGLGEQITHINRCAMELLERWKLIVIAAVFAVVFAYSYLLLLQSLAHPLIYCSLLVVLISSGVLMVVCFQKSMPVVVSMANAVRELDPVRKVEDALPPLGFIGFDWVRDLVFVAESVVPDVPISPALESIKAELKATSDEILAKIPSLHALEKLREFSLEGMVRPLAGIYTLHVLLVLALCSAALCARLTHLLMYSKKKIKFAGGCVETACSVLFTIEALWLLPLFQFVAWTGTAYAFLSCMFHVMSTVPVESEAINVAGFEVRGIGRTFSPDTWQGIQIALWLGAFLWAEVMIHVLCHFVASYAAVQWLFSPYDGANKKAPTLLVPTGFLAGVFFHCGSLALVAALRILVWPLEWMSLFAALDQDRGGIMSILLNAVDCCLHMCTTMTGYLSPHIVTELALHGRESFCRSSRTVTQLMATNVKNAEILHGAELLFTLVGTLFISAATSVSMVLAIHNPNLINVDVLRDLEGADVNLFAVVGALLGGCIGYVFMRLQDHVAGALMYCYHNYKKDEGNINTSMALRRVFTCRDLQ